MKLFNEVAPKMTTHHEKDNNLNSFEVVASFLHGVFVGAAKSVADTGEIDIKIIAEASETAGEFVEGITSMAANVASQAKRNAEVKKLV